MLLSDALIGSLLVLLLTCAVLRMQAERCLPTRLQADATADLTAGAAVLLLLVMMCARSIDFGVDTIAYVEVFRDYCANRPLGDFDHSFGLSAAMLNTAMLGACNARLVPAAWALILLCAIAAASGTISLRVRYAALLLGSMVGIELMTNALRQGFAVVILVAAFSHWPQRRLLAACLCALALALHNSMALALMATLLASLPWRWFVPGFMLAVVAVMGSLEDAGLLVIAQPLLYEITKYMAHEGDEIYVRLLTGTALLAAVVTPWLACTTTKQRMALVRHTDFGRAVRLACTAIPFMALPYFGYRFVYAVLPMVLWLTLRAGVAGSAQPARHVALMATTNMTLLLVWALGSSYIREIPLGDWLP